ncbi:hypothetical protein Tco_1347994, partial [Tanacetum coccineum]
EKLQKALQAVCEKLNQQDQAANVRTYTPEPSRCFNIIYNYDDDDEESTIPLNEITSQIPPSIAITPYISSDVNPLFNEVLEDIENKDSYVSNLDKPALLVTPFFDANEDECFDPGGDIDKIGAFLDIDISTDIQDGCHDSDGDIIYLESLLINDTIPNLPPKIFLDHDPRSLKDEPDDNDLKSKVKVFDPGIHEKIISAIYVRLPFEDRHYLSLTYVIQICLPYFTYPVDSSLLYPSGNEDTIFDPDISVFSCYSLEPVISHQSGTFVCFNVYLNILNESPMGIFSSICFVPNITMIYGESS